MKAALNSILVFFVVLFLSASLFMVVNGNLIGFVLAIVVALYLVEKLHQVVNPERGVPRGRDTRTDP